MHVTSVTFLDEWKDALVLVSRHALSNSSWSNPITPTIIKKIFLHLPRPFERKIDIRNYRMHEVFNLYLFRTKSLISSLLTLLFVLVNIPKPFSHFKLWEIPLREIFPFLNSKPFFFILGESFSTSNANFIWIDNLSSRIQSFWYRFWRFWLSFKCFSLQGTFKILVFIYGEDWVFDNHSPLWS